MSLCICAFYYKGDWTVGVHHQSTVQISSNYMRSIWVSNFKSCPYIGKRYRIFFLASISMRKWVDPHSGLERGQGSWLRSRLLTIDDMQLHLRISVPPENFPWKIAYLILKVSWFLWEWCERYPWSFFRTLVQTLHLHPLWTQWF